MSIMASVSTEGKCCQCVATTGAYRVTGRRRWFGQSYTQTQNFLWSCGQKTARRLHEGRERYSGSCWEEGPRRTTADNDRHSRQMEGTFSDKFVNFKIPVLSRATYRDYLVWHLSVCSSVCLSGSHTFWLSNLIVIVTLHYQSFCIIFVPQTLWLNR